MSTDASSRTKTKWGIKHKLLDTTVYSGWTYSQASELGDFEDNLLIISNSGTAQTGIYQIQACADINDADWYSWTSGTLAAGNGLFESLTHPWGAIRVRCRCSNASGAVFTVWNNVRLRT